MHSTPDQISNGATVGDAGDRASGSMLRSHCPRCVGRRLHGPQKIELVV